MKRILRGVCALGLCLSGIAAIASGEQQSDYKELIQHIFIGEVIYPEEQGDFQLNFLPEFRHGRSADTTLFPLALEYGLTDRLEFSLSAEAYKIRNPDEGSTTRGYGNTEIGLKYSLMHIHHSNYSAALGMDVEFPTGSINKDLTEGFIEYEPYVMLAKDMPKFAGSQLYTQFGPGILSRQKSHHDPDENDSSATEFIWNTGLIVPYKQLRYIAQINLKTNEWLANGKKTELYATPGLIWQANHHVELGLGVPIGLTNKSDHYRIMATVVIET